MFERVIAQTIQKITTEVLQERALIPLLDILQDARIPARFKPFFETEVHWWLYNEALARGVNKRFDYEHPEVTSLLNYLEQVQFRHARFEREEFLTVLDSAVKLTYNYLCRPQTTLKWYIFRGQPVKPLNEVMLRFGAFLDYDYLQAVFIDWVDRKRAERPTFDAISATEFERVIRRVDDQILLNCSVDGLLEIMDPLFDFIGEGPDQLVPVDALVIFFDDKNIKKLVDQLENFRERGGESVGREGFVAILDELLSSADDEPDVDFSNVYQNDALDDVVRKHLESEGRHQEDPFAPQPEYIAPQPEYIAPAPPVEPPQAFAPEEYFDDATPARSEPPVADIPAGDESDDEEVILEFDLVMEEDLDDLTGESSPSRSLDEISGDGGEGSSDAAPFPVNGAIHEERAADMSNEIGDDDDDDATTLEEMDDDEDEGPRFSGFDGSALAGQLRDLEGIPPTEPTVPAPAAETMTSASSVATPAAPAEASAPNRSEPSLEDVRRFIDTGLERKVVKKIFAKDREAYEGALDRVNAATSWRAASQVLDEIFIRYSVDPYSRTAIRFTDSVYGRYLK